MDLCSGLGGSPLVPLKEVIEGRGDGAGDGLGTTWEIWGLFEGGNPNICHKTSIQIFKFRLVLSSNKP